MKSHIVAVKNVARLATAGEALVSRAIGAPGMGLIDGETGYGKTTAIAWYINKRRGAFVRAQATWTPSAMLRAICRELDIPARFTCSDMVDDIAEAMRVDPRSLFVDEADYIVSNNKMTDSLRDVHDIAQVPVVLIGMHDRRGGIEQKLAHRKQLTGRMAQHVRFQPCDMEDMAKLASELCEVEVREDLLHRVHANANGSVRLTVVSLARIEQRAKARRLSSIGAAEWGATDALFTGEAPTAAAAGGKVAQLHTGAAA